ncbi:MAG TPA: HAD family hydrolase [Eoetvoesiella sp.]
MALTAAVFLDKDGTVLENVPYNVDPVRMHFAPGAMAGISRLSGLGLPLIIISNQPGVALGKFPVSDLLIVRDRLECMFRSAGATLAGFYCCPHHPGALQSQYALECSCRKPAPGMLQQAAREYDIDLAKSWLIGDILDDVEAGRRAGCKTILLDNGNETEWLHNEWRQPDRIEPSLDEASRWIAMHRQQAGLGDAK